MLIIGLCRYFSKANKWIKCIAYTIFEKINLIFVQQAHDAITKFQRRLEKDKKKVTVVTQNIDGLHQKSGTVDVIELHGSLYKTRCTKCKHVEFNETVPICPALADKW